MLTLCSITPTGANGILTTHMQGMKEKITKRSASLNVDVAYEKTQSISQLPYYLGIQFVRFWWKPEAQIKAKICRVSPRGGESSSFFMSSCNFFFGTNSQPVEFPLVLDVFDLCTEPLRNKLAENRKILIARDEARQAREKSGNREILYEPAHN